MLHCQRVFTAPQAAFAVPRVEVPLGNCRFPVIATPVHPEDTPSADGTAPPAAACGDQHHVVRTLEYISHSNKPPVPKPVATDPDPTRC